MAFIDTLKKYDWQELEQIIYSKTEDQVEEALKKAHRNLEDFAALISPAAAKYLEPMAALSKRLTEKRFGKTVRMYVPLYLSNKCANRCVYCGFSHDNHIDRLVLNDEEIMQEVKVIKSYGYEHLLLVTGEFPSEVGIDYFKHVIELVKPHFSQISIEVQPMKQEEYEALIDLGLNAVYIYQETYNEANYNKYHLGGKKADFGYRLDTPDRLGKAGIHKLGIGCLLGLEDWRVDSFMTALHLKYLCKKYWKTRFSISFPRLRPHMGNFEPNSPINDKELLQLITAYRLLDEDVELSISVRESQKFRDHVIQLGITSMSAGSRTEPGGYSKPAEALEQFEVHDNRSPQEIMQMIKQRGYEPVWKDWDSVIQQ